MSLSTKTIVILDHSSNMSRKVQSAINFDQLVVKKNKAQAESPNRSPIKVSQTLWTCATQSVSGTFVTFILFSLAMFNNVF